MAFKYKHSDCLLTVFPSAPKHLRVWYIHPQAFRYLHLRNATRSATRDFSPWAFEDFTCWFRCCLDSLKAVKCTFRQPDNVSNSSTPIVLLSRTNNGLNLSISTYIIHIQRQMYDQTLFYLFEIASSFILHHTSTFLSLLIILISLHTQLFIFQFFKYISCWTPFQSHPLSQFVTLYIWHCHSP